MVDPGGKPYAFAMILSHDALVLVSDGARAVFFRNIGTAIEPKLKAVNVFEQDNPATREQGTDHPTRSAVFRGGEANQGGSPGGNIEQADWHQLNEDRFTRNIAGKLYELAHANSFQQLVIVAPPKVLGVLRETLHKEVLQRVAAEILKEMVHAPVAAIQDALSS